VVQENGLQFGTSGCGLPKVGMVLASKLEEAKKCSMETAYQVMKRYTGVGDLQREPKVKWCRTNFKCDHLKERG
jgi:hypothetical protein